MSDYKLSIPYTGTKNKLLDFVLPKLNESGAKILISPFSGSFAVEMNYKADRYYLNDLNVNLIKMYQFIRDYADFKYLDYSVKDTLKCFDLSKDNKEAYNDFRELYNHKIGESDKPYYLMILMMHSFSNQIRFNKKGEFNLPFGERSYNNSYSKKLNNLYSFLKENKTILNCESYDYFLWNIIYNQINSENINDYVIYLDPPYNDTTATYNENGGWNLEKELELYRVLKYLKDNNIKFVMSNVLRHNSQDNISLIDFISKNNLKYDTKEYIYGNCSANKKNKEKSIECIVYNY